MDQTTQAVSQNLSALMRARDSIHQGAVFEIQPGNTSEDDMDDKGGEELG